MRWMNLEPIIQSESEREVSYSNTYICNPDGETDIENRLMDTGRGEKRVRCMERATWKLTLPYVK